MGVATVPHEAFSRTPHGIPTLIRAPPAVFLALKPSSDITPSDYSASIPEAPNGPPSLELVIFERDERPRRNSATLPRHSPLPAARPPAQHARRPAAPDGLFVVDRPGALQRLRQAAATSVGGGPGLLHPHSRSPTASRRSSLALQKEEISCAGLIVSFWVGVLCGLLPVVLLLLVVLGRPRLAEDSVRWDQRTFVYGRSIGLLVLIAVAIAVVIIVVV